MSTLLLVANVLVLAVLMYISYRIISTARRRSEEKSFPASGQEASFSLAIGSEVTDKANLAPPSPVSELHEKEVPQTIAAPVVLAAISSNVVHPAIEEDLPYADPVDGMPFEPDEYVIPCVCGLAYREESVKWLVDYHAGCCIHCGVRVNFPQGHL